jgi:hypothetical protein
MEVFATLSRGLEPTADSSQSRVRIFDLQLKSPMNLVRRNISVEKSNNHSLLVVRSAK